MLHHHILLLPRTFSVCISYITTICPPSSIWKLRTCVQIYIRPFCAWRLLDELSCSNSISGKNVWDDLTALLLYPGNGAKEHRRMQLWVRRYIGRAKAGESWGKEEVYARVQERNSAKILNSHSDMHVLWFFMYIIWHLIYLLIIFFLLQVVHPIHDQTFYLNTEHKRKLKDEYG